MSGRLTVVTEEGGNRSGVPKVYAAGDMRRGQSLVVWAIREGRNAARAVDDDAAVGIRLCFVAGMPFDNLENSLFRQHIVPGTVLFKTGEEFFEFGHILFVAHHFQHIAASYDAEFRA